MNLINLLILQFIAQILTDFIFQSHKYAIEKNEIGFKSNFLPFHALIAFVFSWILSFQVSFIYASAIIGITHYIFDGLKMFLNRKKNWEPYAFFIDQILHLFVIGLSCVIYSFYASGNNLVLPFLTTKHLLIILALIACSKPANIFIKQVFHLFEINMNIEDDLPNAGKLIGNLERWLILIFIISHHFEAVGFLIAAKSILRFKNDDTLRSEYVLIGTMLSFGIAILFGILINHF